MSLLVQPALHTQAGCSSRAVVKPGMGIGVCLWQGTAGWFPCCGDGISADPFAVEAVFAEIPAPA